MVWAQIFSLVQLDGLQFCLSCCSPVFVETDAPCHWSTAPPPRNTPKPGGWPQDVLELRLFSFFRQGQLCLVMIRSRHCHLRVGQSLQRLCLLMRIHLTQTWRDIVVAIVVAVAAVAATVAALLTILLAPQLKTSKF